MVKVSVYLDMHIFVMDAAEYIIEQRSRRYFANVQDDLQLHILRMFKGIFSLDVGMYKLKIVPLFILNLNSRRHYLFFFSKYRK